MFAWAWVALLLTGYVIHAGASQGDTDVVFRACLERCVSSYCASGETAALPMALRMFGWDCESNCQYECMHDVNTQRISRGFYPLKYYGKWPFLRVLGCQEFLSVLFSLINAVPHCLFLVALRTQIPQKYSFRKLYITSALVHLNTWVCSAAFHARDTLLTERLDYYSATFSVIFSFFVALLRCFDVRFLPFQIALGSLLCAIYVLHVMYLQFIHFDYGWNMKVTGLFFFLYVITWFLWSAFFRRPRRSLLAMSISVGLLLASSAELFDFPPLGGLLDAHALWHALTPPLSFLFYWFLIADAQEHLIVLSKGRHIF